MASSDERIIIVAHYLLYGAAHALRDYLLEKKGKKLTCIFLPLASQRTVFVTSYSGKRKMYDKCAKRKINLGFLEYFWDSILTINFVVRQKKYDHYMGFDALNCFSGLLLKKIGKVKKVTFYSIDFVPVRFHN